MNYMNNIYIVDKRFIRQRNKTLASDWLTSNLICDNMIVEICLAVSMFGLAVSPLLCLR